MHGKRGRHGGRWRHTRLRSGPLGSLVDINSPIHLFTYEFIHLTHNVILRRQAGGEGSHYAGAAEL